MIQISPEGAPLWAQNILDNRSKARFERDEIEGSICLRFERIVKQFSDHVAVRAQDVELSYSELDLRANQVANAIQAQCGNRREPVSILFEQEADAIVALMGVLKSGKFYVPLDPLYPVERNLYTLHDIAPALLLTNRRHEEVAEQLIMSCDSRQRPKTLFLEDTPRRCDSDNPKFLINPDDLAYVIYTSGSTGTPKGVMQNHRNTLSDIRRQATAYSTNPGDRFAMLFSPCSSASTASIFGALLCGAATLPFDLRMGGFSRFKKWLIDKEISILDITTAAFRELCQNLGPADLFPHLRVLCPAGEPLHRQDAELFRQYFSPNCVLQNALGTTETRTVTQFFINSETELTESLIPIGRPVNGKSLLLLDNDRKEVENGEIGEIAVRSDYLSPGYWKRDDLTKEVFIEDSSGGCERTYLTGDLGRFDRHGMLFHLGRKDFQVKIRGYRIEISEVEMALQGLQEVAEAAVVAPEDPMGNRFLVAYIVMKPGCQLSIPEVRRHLAQWLPEHAIPTVFEIRDTLPKNLNGKLDRMALIADAKAHAEQSPELSVEAITKNDKKFSPESPATDVETRLKTIWTSTLRRADIDIDDNFFDLGGHSLLAIRLLNEVVRSFNLSVTLAELVQQPTVREMARLLRDRSAGKRGWSPLVTLQPLGDGSPLFCAPVAGGSTFYYRYLAMHIGSDRPLYTFEPLGMHQGDNPHESVEEMAAYYLRFLRSVQPKGPYHLCGLSFGGLVAYEMAQQLTASGERVASLIFFDSWAPGYPETVRVSGNAHRRRILRNGRYHIHAHWDSLDALSSLSERGMYIVSRVTRLPERIQAVYRSQSFGKHRANPASAELPENFQKIQQSQEKAQKDYLPGSYSGSAVLLRARVQDPQWQYHASMGWERFVDDLEVIVTPGTHHTMLDEPCIHRTLEQVRHVLKRSET